MHHLNISAWNKMIYSTIKRNKKSFPQYPHNYNLYEKSLWKHVGDVISDNRIINNDIIGFTETRIIPSVQNNWST